MFTKIYRILLFILLIAVGAGDALAKPDAKKFTVVVDAGHGGKDIGATDNGVMEKNINLQVAKQLESLIKKKLKNSNVVMTRDADSYLTLQQRADKANKAKGDLFISIHTNSVDKRNPNRKSLAGSSVYTLGLHKDESNLEVAMRENSVIELEKDYAQKYSGFDPQKDESYIIFEMAQKQNLSQSIKFAEYVEKELVKSGRQERGVHQAGFWVLWATSMPAVLVELDFICNPQSAKYLSSEKGAKELAEAIFKAIEKYEASWRKSQTSSTLSSSYIEDSESQLEETYVETSSGVATAKKRGHRPTVSSNQSGKKTDNLKRRRRSASSRTLSMNQSYESAALSSPQMKDYSATLVQEAPVLAATPTKEQSKKEKAEQKKREKEEKKRLQAEQKKRKRDAHNAKLNKLVTVYKIQILASSDLLSEGNARFCGLAPISTFKENNLYKYYYGESTDKAEMEMMLANVRKKIPDAFIVTSQKSIQKK